MSLVSWIVLIVGPIVLAEVLARRLLSRVDYDCRRADGYLVEGADWASRYFLKEWRWVQQAVRWEPFSYWRGGSHRGEFINIDGRGLRLTWNVSTKARRKRVFLFGGSTMWGAGVRDGGTIPSLVARLLEVEGIPSEVVNCGQIGYVSTQELITLTRLLQDRELPDLVVFYDGYNDVLSALLNGRAGLSYREHHRSYEFNLLRRSGGLAWSVVRSLGLVRCFGGEGDKRAAVRPLEELRRLAEDVARVELATFRCVKGLGREFGFDVQFFWQPTIFDKRQLTAHERIQHDLIAFSAPVFADVARHLRATCGKENDQYLILDDIFRNAEQPYFIDWAHLTEGGNELVARRIVRVVAPKLRAGVGNGFARPAERVGEG